MSNVITKVWKELEEVSVSLSTAKNKLHEKLEMVVANLEENYERPEVYKHQMYQASKEVDKSKSKIAEVQRLVQGLQMRLVEVQDLTQGQQRSTKILKPDSLNKHNLKEESPMRC